MTGSTMQPHDKLFKAMLDQPGMAATLIRERLPPAIVSLLTGDPPEPVDGSFVDENLRASQSDRLFRVRLRTGGDAFLFVLMDHKSAPDPRSLLQLLGYILRIWTRAAGNRAEAHRHLPPILPIVLYHGAAPWNVAENLRDTIDAPPNVKALQPDFQYTLIDLGPIPDQDLSAFAPLRAGLLALKYSHWDGDPEGVLVRVLSDVRDVPAMMRLLVVYATAVFRSLTPASLGRAVRRVRPEWEEEMLSIAAREWMAEGAAKGRAEGLADMLLRLCRKKYGEVPTEAANRIKAAGIADLDRWSDRFFEAETIDEMFGG